MAEAPKHSRISLHGYRDSVYSWVARFVLIEKNIDFDWVEVDPFSSAPLKSYLKLNPFRRVPTLVHNGFVLYETSAIVQFLDDSYPEPQLQPSSASDRARVLQIISIVDSYLYWPLVRQVFSHGYWQQLYGAEPDPEEFQQGLAAAPLILSAINSIVHDREYLVGEALSLADLYLAPFLSYFALTDKGKTMLGTYPVLCGWLQRMTQRQSYVDSKPQFAGL